MSKRADLSVGSSNILTCPLQDLGKCSRGGRIFNGKVRNYAVWLADTCAQAEHMYCMATSNSSDCLRRTLDDICQEIHLYGRRICGDTRAVAPVGHVAPS